MLFRHVAKSIGHECLSYEKRTKTYESRRGLLGRSSRCRFVVGSGLSRDAFPSRGEEHRA
jgi:hypothetical protein